MGRRRRKTYTEQEQGVQQPVYAGELQEWPTAIYARLSVENSGKDDKGESIEGQTELCRDYIEEHPDLHLYDTYIDNDWTGIKTKEYKWLLDNACMVELFSEINNIK